MCFIRHSIYRGVAIPSALIALLVALALASCGKSAAYRQLALADSLVCRGASDSALAVLDRLRDRADLTEEEEAYRALLTTQADYLLYHPIDTDTLISKSVAYYEKAGDRRKLASAYFYRARVLGCLERKREEVALLKRAETVAADCNDLDLSHKIYDALTVTNYFSGNTRLSLRYALLTKQCAERKNDKFWLAYAYNHLVYIYDELGQRDSSAHYLRKCMPYLDVAPPPYQADLLQELGKHYLLRGRLDEAHDYLSQAYRRYPLPDVCKGLATYYHLRGDRERSDAYLRQALDSSSVRERVGILDHIYRQRVADGQFREACQTAERLMAERDSLARYQQTATIQETQLRYDQEMTRRYYDRQLIRFLYAFIVVTVVVAAIIIRYMVSNYRAKQQITHDQMLISEYNHQIETLKKSEQDAGQQREKEISDLKRKIDRILDKQTGVLVNGHRLYDCLAHGKTAITWSKTETHDFIEYYKVVDLSFFLQLDNDYEALSPGNLLLLILQHEGYTDEDISRILGISNGAIRTARSRIKAKKRRLSP